MFTDPSSDRHVSARELAAIYSVCERTIRSWELRGLLPAPVRVGRSKRWRLAEVVAHLKAHQGGRADAS